MNNIKVAQYGTGKMSIYTMKYAMEKGYNIVAAFDIDKDVLGKDIGQLIGSKDLIGIKVHHIKDAPEMLKNIKPDICIIETLPLLKDVYEPFKLCAELGINVISTSQEAFYPMNSNPSLTKQLDSIAKNNNCTITGSGFQDVYLCNLVSAIAGSINKIEKIRGGFFYNIEDFGREFALAHGAGLSVTEFAHKMTDVNKMSTTERNEMIKQGNFIPSFMWNSSYALANKLGLEVISQTEKTVPHTYIEDLKSHSLDQEIKAGDATGMITVNTILTKEGVEIETQYTAKVYGKDEKDRTEWTIYGDPNVTITIDDPSTPQLTCATIVNRIKDVINAEPGFITIDQMNYPKYISKIE